MIEQTTCEASNGQTDYVGGSEGKDADAFSAVGFQSRTVAVVDQSVGRVCRDMDFTGFVACCRYAELGKAVVKR